MSELSDLLTKQRELMIKVPHDVSSRTFSIMQASTEIFEVLLLYYNSTGGKPWRPQPLSQEVQGNRIEELRAAVDNLIGIHKMDNDLFSHLGNTGQLPRQYVSVFGVVEESIEYLTSLTDGSDTPNRLEELVDILFFYLELIAMSGFTIDQIVQQYKKKHAVNLARYESAKKGDYSWDNRSSKDKL